MITYEKMEELRHFAQMSNLRLSQIDRFGRLVERVEDSASWEFACQIVDNDPDEEDEE